MLSVVNGKHWIAQRIPDNHIAVIPNYYTIGEIDLADTLNFLGSADIVEYAIEREWYDPDNGPFNFREAYSSSRSLKSKTNIYRMWRGTNLLSEVEYDVDDDFPFSFDPEKNIGVWDFMIVVRDHYEGTDLHIDNQNPHMSNIRSICSNTNQYGFVAQLRSEMPVEIGALLWIAPRRPCIQSFIPWYSGITKVPDGFGRNTYVIPHPIFIHLYRNLPTGITTRNLRSIPVTMENSLKQRKQRLMQLKIICLKIRIVLKKRF
jgi:dipeptidase